MPVSVLPFISKPDTVLGCTSKMNVQCKQMIAIPGEGVWPNVCTWNLKDTEEVATNPAAGRRIESKGFWEERHHSQVDKRG